MELSLNLLWLLLAGVSLAFAWRDRGQHTLARGHTAKRMVSLACALVIFFPVISLTDDLHAAQVVMEDSSAVKRISKSSGAPGGGSNLERSVPPFALVTAGLAPGQPLRLLGLTGVLEFRLLAAAPAEWPNLRGPPSPVSPS